MQLRAMRYLTSAHTFVQRTELERLELMQGVRCMSELIFSEDWPLKEMSLEQVKTIIEGFIKSEDQNRFLLANGIAIKATTFTHRLPHVLFSLDKPCDSCGGNHFARKVSNRTDYQNSKKGNYIGYTPSTEYRCVNPYCGALYSIEDNEHKFMCPCNRCGLEAGLYPYIRTVIPPEHWSDLFHITLSQRRVINSSVTLCDEQDVKGHTALLRIVFEILAMIFKNIEFRAPLGNEHQGPSGHIGIPNAARIMTHYVSSWKEVDNTLSLEREIPISMNLTLGMSFVRGLLVKAYPDDRDTIARVSEYAYLILRADADWQAGLATLKSKGLIKILNSLCEKAIWSKSLAESLGVDFKDGDINSSTLTGKHTKSLEEFNTALDKLFLQFKSKEKAHDFAMEAIEERYSQLTKN